MARDFPYPKCQRLDFATLVPEHVLWIGSGLLELGVGLGKAAAPRGGGRRRGKDSEGLDSDVWLSCTSPIFLHGRNVGPGGGSKDTSER